MSDATPNQELWYQIFALGHPDLSKFQTFHKRLPSPPRCKLCFAPFKGPGSILMRFKHKRPSSRNPLFCNACDQFITAFPGGAEVELSFFFVDVRGSTSMAQHMSPTQFSQSMNSFYAAATKIIYQTDGFIIDLVGDEVFAVYPPGFSGAEHADKAITAAGEMLRKPITASDGSQIPIGIGVHTGVAYIGTVTGSGAGPDDVRALGDDVNITARLASMAGPGEALLSDSACSAASFDGGGLESRQLEVRGRDEPVNVRVIPSSKP